MNVIWAFVFLFALSVWPWKTITLVTLELVARNVVAAVFERRSHLPYGTDRRFHGMPGRRWSDQE